MTFSISEALERKSVSRYEVACLLGLLVVLPTGWISAWTWEQNIRSLYLILIAFFCSTLLVPVSMDLAKRVGAIDLPDPRKVHKSPTPRLGGLAVYGAAALTIVRNDYWTGPTASLLAAGTIIFLLGAWDDCKGLSARFRLFGQLAAAGVAIAGGLRVNIIPSFPGDRLVEIAVTVFWLVGVTNAVAFLDGIDGLASGMGALCAALFLSIAWPGRQKPLAFDAAALAGACLGFLPYNWQPARVFLGDGGATFIGFMLAGLAIRGSHAEQYPLVAVATPLLVLGIPIFDMIYTTLSRVRRGAVRTVKQWIEFTGRDHFHHRLMHLGLTAPGAVQFILLLNLVLGLGALVIRYTASRLASALLLAQTFLIFVVIVVLMLLGRELTPDD